MSTTQTQTQIVAPAELTKIKNSSSVPVQRAQTFIVKSPVDENKAYEILTNIKDVRKNIEKRRKEITAPLNTSLNAANAMFKELDKPLKDADTILRDKVLEYRDEQEAIAAAKQAEADEAAVKEQARREAIQESHKARGHETHELEEIVPEEVVADVGESITSRRWTFEVTDIKIVPRAYLALDTVAVNKAVRDGERDIKGLRIYQETGLRV